MIGWIQGPVRGRWEDRVIVDAGGVGYVVMVPSRIAIAAELEDVLTLHVHTYVREDQITLYGFTDEKELSTFHILTTVKGVGPRMAVAILDGISPEELVVAVEGGDTARLKSCKGVGKRMAERLALELRGKLPQAVGGNGSAGTNASQRGAIWRDLESALSNLQYRKKEIDAALIQLQMEQGEAEDFDELLRAALGHLRR
jgi:Holliday junction DNA helicase RuvA